MFGEKQKQKGHEEGENVNESSQKVVCFYPLKSKCDSQSLSRELLNIPLLRWAHFMTVTSKNNFYEKINRINEWPYRVIAKSICHRET